jgi:hypothetical protein
VRDKREKQNWEEGKVKGGAEKMAEGPTLPILQNREGWGTKSKPSEQAERPATTFLLGFCLWM